MHITDYSARRSLKESLPAYISGWGAKNRGRGINVSTTPGYKIHKSDKRKLYNEWGLAMQWGGQQMTKCGFGMIPVKGEGAPCRPDYGGIGFTGGEGMTDERYLKQLQAYADYYGVGETKSIACTRPGLLDRLK